MYGGISRYFCELIKGIEKTNNKAHLSLLYSNNAYLKEYELNVRPYPFQKRHRLLVETNRLFNVFDFKLGNYDLYHATYFNPSFISAIGKKPYVVTYYDMIHEKLGGKFDSLRADTRTIEWKREIAKRASGLIAISENTKKDMVDYLDVSPERIDVIYLSSSMKINYERIDDAEIGEKYLLFVGNRDVYKNFIPFLDAVAPILLRYQINLICAGGRDFDETERNTIKHLGIGANVEYRAVTDQTLSQLYSQAIAFVFPSLYEGFGIPILEAMSCGCPCLLSDSSSMPEIGGEAALYFNPSDVDDMRLKITQLLDDECLRSDLSKAGINRAALFSWQDTVARTLSLYERIV